MHYSSFSSQMSRTYLFSHNKVISTSSLSIAMHIAWQKSHTFYVLVFSCHPQEQAVVTPILTPTYQVNYRVDKIKGENNLNHAFQCMLVITGTLVLTQLISNKANRCSVCFLKQSLFLVWKE